MYKGYPIGTEASSIVSHSGFPVDDPGLAYSRRLRGNRRVGDPDAHSLRPGPLLWRLGVDLGQVVLEDSRVLGDLPARPADPDRGVTRAGIPDGDPPVAPAVGLGGDGPVLGPPADVQRAGRLGLAVQPPDPPPRLERQPGQVDVVGGGERVDAVRVGPGQPLQLLLAGGTPRVRPVEQFPVPYGALVRPGRVAQELGAGMVLGPVLSRRRDVAPVVRHHPRVLPAVEPVRQAQRERGRVDPPQVHLGRRAEEFGEDRVQLTADLVGLVEFTHRRSALVSRGNQPREAVWTAHGLSMQWGVGLGMAAAYLDSAPCNSRRLAERPAGRAWIARSASLGSR